MSPCDRQIEYISHSYICITINDDLYFMKWFLVVNY